MRHQNVDLQAGPLNGLSRRILRNNRTAIVLTRAAVWCGLTVVLLMLTPSRYGLSTALLLPVCVLVCRWMSPLKSASICIAAWLLSSVALTVAGWATGAATAVGAMAVHPVGVVLVCVVVVLVALGSSGILRDRT